MENNYSRLTRLFLVSIYTTMLICGLGISKTFGSSLFSQCKSHAADGQNTDDYLPQKEDTIQLLPGDPTDRGFGLDFRSYLQRGVENSQTTDQLNESFISVQQLLIGNFTGVYVQENSGEPGTIQSMLIRRSVSPIFKNKDIAGGVQPVVFVNGIPLIDNHPLRYDIQQFDVNPIGSATNLLSTIDINNIETIEVITDPAGLAKLGPLAVNGASRIVTKNRGAQIGF